MTSMFRNLALLLLIGCLVAGAAANTTAPANLSAHPTAPLITELEPLSVRGMNYYARLTPWDDFWAKTPVEVVARDMGLMSILNVNTVRIFLPWNEKTEEAGLIEPDGTVTEKYLARFESLVELAWRHRIRVVPCFTFGYHEKKPALPGEKASVKALTAFVDRYSTDGRILMWDVMNEPERDGWTEAESAWIKLALKTIKKLDKQHLVTVGIANDVEKLAEVQLPDVIQYHEYAPKAELWNQRQRRVKKSIDRMRSAGGERPVLIGEFGSSTASDPRYGADADWLKENKGAKTEVEADQRMRYQWILETSEKERVTGVMAWCLHDYPTSGTGWLTPAEGFFGVVRADGSVKPAGALLRAFYQKWEQQPREAAAPASAPAPNAPIRE